MVMVVVMGMVQGDGALPDGNVCESIIVDFKTMQLFTNFLGMGGYDNDISIGESGQHVAISIPMIINDRSIFVLKGQLHCVLGLAQFIHISATYMETLKRSGGGQPCLQ